MVFRFAKASGSLQQSASSQNDRKHPQRHSTGTPLCELPQGQCAVIHEVNLADSSSEQVMLFGFMPGVEVVAGQCGPGGDPRVYRLDGIDVAIRRDTARQILVRPALNEESV